jgi:hypothetical protein
MDQCNSCRSLVMTWREMSPGKMHRYRVECRFCTKWVRWGTNAQLSASLAGGATLNVISYAESATLEDFLSG